MTVRRYKKISEHEACSDTFSHISGENFKSTIVIEDTNLRYASHRFVGIFRNNGCVRHLRGRLLRGKILLWEEESCRLWCSRGHFIRFICTWLSGSLRPRDEHVALAVYQPPHVDLWESFVDTVNGVECRFCSAIEDTRECSLGYAYLRSECFLRHSHLFHQSNNAILHNFTACMGQSPPVYISKPNAKLRNSVQLSKLLI